MDAATLSLTGPDLAAHRSALLRFARRLWFTGLLGFTRWLWLPARLCFPGLTGLWQVSGRSRLGTLEMLRMDVEYVHTRSLRGDLAILLATAPSLLRGDGAR